MLPRNRDDRQQPSPPAPVPEWARPDRLDRFIDLMTTAEQRDLTGDEAAELLDAVGPDPEAVAAARRRRLGARLDVPPAGQACEIPKQFLDSLVACKNTRQVVGLLLDRARSSGLKNIRFHRYDSAANTLKLTASAGLDPVFEQQLRDLGGFVKHCLFLDRTRWDSLWVFFHQQPTLLRVDPSADFPLTWEFGPSGLPTVPVPEDQCERLKGFKGTTWVDLPLQFRGRDSGKLSCDVDPDEADRPDFRDRVHAFWELARAAAVYLELHAIEEAKGSPAAPTRHPVPELTTVLSQGVHGWEELPEWVSQYEVTHGAVDNAAIAAYVARMIRSYQGQAMAIDGGTTNAAVVDAILRDVAAGHPSVRTIMTNNLRLRVPCRDDFPVVLHPPGRVRFKNGEPVDVVCDEAAIRWLRDWRFAVSVIGASGFDPPVLFTGTGQDYDVKRALLRLSTDAIVPLPSYKWRITGQGYLDLSKRSGRTRNLSIVTVFPHEDARDPRSISKWAYKFQEHFRAGVAKVAGYGEGVRFNLARARFLPESGLHPTIETLSESVLEKALPNARPTEQGLWPLDDVSRWINPHRHSDVRLVVCITLPMHDVAAPVPPKKLDAERPSPPPAAEDAKTSHS